MTVLVALALEAHFRIEAPALLVNASQDSSMRTVVDDGFDADLRREMQRDEELNKKDAHIEVTYHGANSAALAYFWSKKRSLELKPGPSSC
eukprot:5621953-Pyramimonas_sp.AAC.1